MMRTGSRWGLLALACFSTAASAQFLPYLGYKMYADPFKWHLNDQNYAGSGLSITAIETSTQAAFNAWDNVSCHYLSFSYQGRIGAITPTPKSPTDSYSAVVSWIDSRADPYYNMALGGGEAAAAVIPLTYAGAVLQCDIYTNAVDFAWYAGTGTPTGAQMDLQTVLMREIGHCMGLGDTTINADPPVSASDVMYWSLAPGQVKRTPTTTDQFQLCDYYPLHQYAARCATAGGQSDCATGELKCTTAPLPGGATSVPFCSKGCGISATNSCSPPLVCQTSTLFPGFTGACMPNLDNVTQVGRPCTADIDCGPQPAAKCLVENSGGPLPSGAVRWSQGYCSQTCGTCPSGSTCTPLGTAGSWCLQNCDPARGGGCRGEYSCASVGASSVCVSACRGDIDCPNALGGAQSCRICDGLCFAKDNPATQIGAPCASNTNCGPGHYCFKFFYSLEGICTQSCGSVCGACPNGSTCTSVPPNNTICTRDCQAGTCAGTQQCGPVTGGWGCMPKCALDADCMTGWSCYYGQCTTTAIAADAGGTCALCFRGEGGAGGSGGASDGGSGGGGGPNGGGCGCHAGGAGLFALAAAFAWWSALRRRRGWRPR